MRRALGEEELIPNLAEKEGVDEHGAAVERDVARADLSGGGN